MLKKNSGVAVVEALLVMSVLALFSFGVKNHKLQKENEKQEDRIEECEKLEDFIDYLEYRRFEK